MEVGHVGVGGLVAAADHRVPLAGLVDALGETQSVHGGAETIDAFVDVVFLQIGFAGAGDAVAGGAQAAKDGVGVGGEVNAVVGHVAALVAHALGQAGAGGGT